MRKSGFVGHLLAAFFLTAILSAVASAGNIFDDDFVPPQRVAPTVKPPVEPALPETNPSSTRTPIPPALSPSPTPGASAEVSVGMKAASKRRIPDTAGQAVSRKLLKEALADQLKDHSVAGRRKLAETLLSEGEKANDIPNDHFVLLTNAITAAEEGLSLRLCFKAIDELSETYDVDGLGLRADGVIKIWTTSPIAPAVSITNVQLSFDVLDQLLDESDFTTAGRIVALLQRDATGIVDTDLRAAVLTQIRDATAIDTAQRQVRPSYDRLRNFPDDGPANLAVGSYLCFTRNQWPRGLNFLAKGNDVALKGLAIAELRRPTDQISILALADGWWDAADKIGTVGRITVLQHAAGLYRTVSANLSGLRRLAVEKRIAEVHSAERHRRIDLLEMCDPTADAVAGSWHMEDEALVCDAKAVDDSARLEFRYVPPEEYDFRASFMVDPGSDSLVGQTCLGNSRQFIWFTGGWVNTVCGFGSIKGSDNDNATSKRLKQWLIPGKHYRSVVKVRKTGVEAWLNDQLVSSWKTDYSDLSLADNQRLHHANTIGLDAHRDLVKWDQAEIVEVTGQGTTAK